LTDCLETHGYHCVGVNRGSAVVPKLLEEPIDIVLLDLGLPDLSGLEVLSQIKREETRLGRTIRTIILTGHSDSHLAMEAISRGAYFFFNKPVILAKVIEQIELAISEVEKEHAKLDDVPLVGGLADDALSHLLVEKEQPTPVLAAVRFSFDRLAVIQNSPQHAGVITLRDRNGEGIFVEWAENISARLTYLLALGPSLSETCRHSASFEYFLTQDKAMVGTFFDKLFNELGHFPRCMGEAPAGSKYEGLTEDGIGSAQDQAVTQMVQTTETQALEDVEAMLAEAPDDENLKDWYAFLCYSHGNLVKAISLYTELLESGSENLDYHFYLANAHFKQGDLRSAVEHWRVVVKKGPHKTIGRKSALRIKNALAQVGATSD